MRRLFFGIVLTLVLASPAAAATRYATPLPAADADCSQSRPCDITTAVKDAADGDTVRVASGTYGAPGQPIGDLGIISRELTVQGVMGPQRPVVHTANTVSASHPAAILRDIEFRGGGGVSIYAGRAERIVSAALDADACTAHTGTWSNSLCLGAGTWNAISTYADATVLNDTLVSPHHGIETIDGHTRAANSSFEGTEIDVFVNVGALTLLNSRYVTRENYDEFHETNSVLAAPVYRGPGDYRQGPNAATLDAGADDQVFSTYDLNGNLRKIGSHVDIGAYEQPPAPQLAPAAPTGVGSTGATINATYDGLGGAVTHHVEYGTSDAYGSSTPAVYAPGSTEGGSITVPLTGLTRGSTYHYRVVLVSDGGTVTTPDATFTSSAPPSTTAITLSGVTPSTATVSAEVDTDGAAGTAHFVVDGVARPDIVTSGGQVTDTLTGLAHHSDHTVKLVVTTPSGSAETAPLTFTTPFAAPSAGIVTVSKITPSGATLTAIANTDGAAGTAQFVVDGIARPALATSGGAVTDTLKGLSPGSSHTVVLVVTTPAGTARSAPITFRTRRFDPSLTLSVGKGSAAGQLLLSRRTVTLFVRCGGVSCKAIATGTVKRGRKTLGRLTAPKRALTVRADSRGRLRLRSTAKLRAIVRAELKRHPRARIAILLKGAFTGTDGTRITRTIKINVRRLKR